jgi:hypothetical protein
MTPFVRALEDWRWEVMELLLTSGANVAARVISSALCEAIASDKMSAAVFLIQRLLALGCNPNALDRNDRTPFAS